MRNILGMPRSRVHAILGQPVATVNQRLHGEHQTARDANCIDVYAFHRSTDDVPVAVEYDSQARAVALTVDVRDAAMHREELLAWGGLARNTVAGERKDDVVVEFGDNRFRMSRASHSK